MDKLLATKLIINSGLASVPVVFFSGGADSLLTLYLVRQQANIPVITFLADFTKSQIKQLESLVAEWDLTLYNFPPAQRYFVPNEDGISLVDEYLMNGLSLPVIRDVENLKTGCVADLDKHRYENVNLGFDTIFTGTLREDNHFVTGKMNLGQLPTYKQGSLTFVTPLSDWTKAEVMDALDTFGITDKVIADTGEIKACCECLVSAKPFCHLENKQIEAVTWDGNARLAEFREKFQMEG